MAEKCEKHWYENGDAVRFITVLVIAMFGLLCAIGALIVVLENGINTAADIVAIVSLFTGITGTLVGALLGFQAGSAGKDTLIEKRAEAKSIAEEALSNLPEEKRRDVIRGRVL